MGMKNALVAIGGPEKRQLTRREMMQRLLISVGASAALPMVAASHPFFGHLENEALFEAQDRLPIIQWSPIFLGEILNRQLVALAERIVPGSQKAKVNEFIDLLLSVDNEKNQKDLTDALAAFETESARRFGKHLPALDAVQLDEILTDASAGKAAENSTGDDKQKNGLYEYFENLKGWVSGAYYSSEVGMKELGWTGDYAFASFPGCEHPEGHT